MISEAAGGPTNPFAAASPLPYELPDFAAIRIEHFREAFETGMAEQLDEVAAVATDPAPPTFANTIEPLERSGRVLDRASRVFYLLSSSCTTPELQNLRTEFAPRFAAHADAINLDPRLFARIDALHAARDTLGLSAEQRRLLERYHLDYVRAGAGLSTEDQLRLAELNQRLAVLTTSFGANLLADANDSALHLSDPADLDGLSADAIAAAAAAAAERGLDGYLLTLVLPTHQPALELLTRPDVRRRLLAAAQARGSRGNEHDNRSLVRDIAIARAERAALLSYRSHSDYVLADRTAHDNATLDAMLAQVIPAAVRNARAEQAELEAAKARSGDSAPFEAADWAFYTQQLRRAEHGPDAAALRPYLELERTLTDGVFYAAGQLYGISFRRRADLVAHHPEAVVYEVIDADGSGLGLFIGDFFARDSKRGGAWMESLVTQSELLGQRPVVVNTLNIPHPGPGQPALLTLDEVGTLFHEFGHALHGLFSAVTYPRLAGTAVARDFVEYPSQVNEMWLSWPGVLGRYARHVADDTPLPAELARHITDGGAGPGGYETVSYLGATWIDLAWHRLTAAEIGALTEDPAAFEDRALAAAGLDLACIPPRYRGTYFNHVFSGGYSSGYYSYLWSEVLDADTVDWFTERGGLRRDSGDIFRRTVLSRGGSMSELAAYEAFRGRQPVIEPLLRRRGLLVAG